MVAKSTTTKAPKIKKDTVAPNHSHLSVCPVLPLQQPVDQNSTAPKHSPVDRPGRGLNDDG